MAANVGWLFTLDTGLVAGDPALVAFRGVARGFAPFRHL